MHLAPHSVLALAMRAALRAALLLALATSGCESKRRGRSKLPHSAASREPPPVSPCDGAAAVRLRPDDLCEDPSSTEDFASLVAGYRGGAAKKPKRLSCGSLALFTNAGIRECAGLADAGAARRCRDIHGAFAASRAQIGGSRASSSSVGFVVVNALAEPQLAEWARAYGARAPSDLPSVWWVQRRPAGAAPAADAADAAESAFLMGYELADAWTRTAAGLAAALNSMCDLGLPSAKNQAPLIQAIKEGQVGRLQSLIDGGMQVEPRGPSGTEQCTSDSWDELCYRPLFQAFAEAGGPGDMQLIRPLLSAGAEITTRGDDGSTFMHQMLHDWNSMYVPADVPAEAHPKNMFAKWLIQNSPIDNAAVDNYGQSLYHLVAARHNYHMLEWMLDEPKMRGVDIDAQDLASSTALHYAAGGDSWYPALSKSLMFTTEQASRFHINYNNPPKYAGWENTCLANFREIADASDGNATNFLHIASALNAPNCSFFSRPVELLLRKGSRAVNVQNSAGETPLHRAVYTNDPATVRLLLDAGADATVRSRAGHSAAMLATILGCLEVLALLPLTAEEQAQLAGHETPRVLAGDLIGQQMCDAEGDATAAAAVSEVAQSEETAGGGWWQHETGGFFSSGSSETERLAVPDCEIETRHAANFTAEEFERDFVLLRRPVAVVGAALPEAMPRSRAAERWHRDTFAKRYGHVTVNVAEIPYAASFGRGTAKNDEPMSIGEYVEYMEARSAKDTYPKYIFERGASALRMLPDAGLWDLGFFNTSRLSQHSFQFYLGPPRSGAPNHFHSHAINVLVYGEKRWFLTPPRYAEYSRLAPIEFLEQAVPHRRHNMLQCMQRAGDVLYVPNGWGHAILNTRTSIGFAGEFRVVASLPPMSGHSWLGRDAQRSLMLKSEGFSSRQKIHETFLGME